MKNLKFIAYLVLVFGFSWTHAGSYDGFFRAVISDDPGTIQALVARGFDPNSVDPNGQPGLIRALQAESYLAALALARLPSTRVDIRNPAGETPLMLAALKGEMDVLRVLLARGAAVNGPGWTPLHYAASGDSLPAVQELLAHGAEIDARAPNHQRTPLMMAAMHAGEDVINALLKAGADPGARDQYGETAADLAARIGRDWLAERLSRRTAARKASDGVRAPSPKP
jgi:ankyrin repeat protein